MLESIYIYRYSTFVSLFIPHSYSSIWLKGKWNKLHNFFLLSNTVQLSQKTKHECETPSLHRPYNNLPREQGTNSKFWHYLELEVVSKGHTTSSSQVSPVMLVVGRPPFRLSITPRSDRVFGTNSERGRLAASFFL